MKKIILALFVSLCFTGIHLSAYGQTASLEGAWELKNVELFKNENGSYQPVTYTKSALESNNLAYETLIFNGAGCKVKADEATNYTGGRFNLENNQLKLFLTPLAEVFETTWEGENSMTLTKVYSTTDDTAQTSEYKIILTYKRK